MSDTLLHRSHRKYTYELVHLCWHAFPSSTADCRPFALLLTLRHLKSTQSENFTTWSPSLSELYQKSSRTYCSITNCPWLLLVKLASSCRLWATAVRLLATTGYSGTIVAHRNLSLIPLAHSRSPFLSLSVVGCSGEFSWVRLSRNECQLLLALTRFTVLCRRRLWRFVRLFVCLSVCLSIVWLTDWLERARSVDLSASQTDLQVVTKRERYRRDKGKALTEWTRNIGKEPYQVPVAVSLHSIRGMPWSTYGSRWYLRAKWTQVFCCNDYWQTIVMAIPLGTADDR